MDGIEVTATLVESSDLVSLNAASDSVLMVENALLNTPIIDLIHHPAATGMETILKQSIEEATTPCGLPPRTKN